MTNDSGQSGGDGRGQPPKNKTAAPDAPRRNNVLPIDRGRGAARVTRRHWPISASGISLNSGAGLLIVIGILCGLLISESDRKSLIVSPKPVVPVQPTPGDQTPALATKPAKPSPAIRADAAKPGDFAAPNQAASWVPNRAASYAPTKFQATHKKVFGGCTGELELTSTALRFRCPKQDELDFPINAIASANKDGVVLKSGEKYHFAIANYSKDQAEAIFIAWLSRVQSTSLPNRAF